MEGITDAEYKQAERVWKDFGIQSLWNYHYLYPQSDTLLLVDVLQRWWDKCVEIYKLFVTTKNSMTTMCEKERSQIRMADWSVTNATNSRERHHKWNVTCHTLIWQSQQQVHVRLWPMKGILISHKLVCQQLVWIDNVTKVVCRWFQMEK